MKIAFISNGDPNDNKLWSGTITQIYNCLKKEYEVDVIDVSNFGNKMRKINALVSKIIKVFSRKKYSAIYSILNAKMESRLVNKCVNGNQEYKLVFCAAKSSSIAYSKVSCPIIYLTDATFAQLVDYYEHLSNLSNLTIYEGNRIEQFALEKAQCVVCASEWTQKSIINDYNIPKNKTCIIPFGANIEGEYNENYTYDKIRILFCGVDWKRKGGQIAVDTIKELKRRGHNVKLLFVGCKIEDSVDCTYVTEYGFLNKNIPSDKIKLQEIYKKTNFLLLPTCAECAGIVFAEASAYGVPSFCYNTGGVGTYVVDDVNGKKLPLSASSEEFADLIEYYITNKEKYLQLRKSSREYFETNLNWNFWLEKMRTLIGNL